MTTDLTENDRAVRPGLVICLLATLGVLALHYLIQYLTDVTPLLPRPEDGTGWAVRAFEHHVLQMSWALLAIGILSRGRWASWGLNLRRRAESFRIIRRFCLYYGLYFIGIGFVVQLLFAPAPSVPEPVTAGSVLGRLAFGFLFVGVSEEILFRGLFHTLLARYWTGTFRWRGLEMPVAGVLAALLFTLAHVGFDLQPFAVTHLSWPQLAMAFVLGLFYSWAYHRTGSLLAPIVTHNISDGLLWVSEYVLVFLEG